MPRWKALPEELDPQVREFMGQLRRLVDRSGLSVAAVADRTGYSKTSWERYLNGRLLAPKGAILALAEVTGTRPVHLTTMWELAERAWSRSEMRHDMTMEAIRISQARAALGEPGVAGPAQAEGGPGAPRAGASLSGASGSGPATPALGRPAPPATTPPKTAWPQLTGIPPQSGTPSGTGGPAERGGPAARADAAEAAGPAWSGSPQGGPGAGGVAYGSQGVGVGGPGVSAAADQAPDPGGPGVPPPGGGGMADRQRRRRKTAMFLAGAVGALVLIAAALFVTGPGKDDGRTAKPSPSPSTSSLKLPAGVHCAGKDCAGKDPEKMGCGDSATTADSATVGVTLVEVRYSKTCGAVWARVTGAAPGDTAEITTDAADPGSGKSVTVDQDGDSYTPMLAARKGALAHACATPASGRRQCTS